MAGFDGAGEGHEIDLGARDHARHRGVIEVQGLEDTARDMGIAPDIARLLAVQTAFGAGMTARETGTPPAELRQMVTSPGGTTQAALESLESGDVRRLFATALEAARRRSIELGSGK